MFIKFYVDGVGPFVLNTDMIVGYFKDDREDGRPSVGVLTAYSAKPFNIAMKFDDFDRIMHHDHKYKCVHAKYNNIRIRRISNDQN